MTTRWRFVSWIRKLHPDLAIRIRAKEELQASTAKAAGMKLRVFVLPHVSVNTFHTERVQIELRLFGNGWELGPYPMEKLREQDHYENFMSNPKVFMDEPGEYAQDLGFARDLGRFAEPDLTGLQLGFRWADLGQDQPWTKFDVPGEFDNRKSQETIHS